VGQANRGYVIHISAVLHHPQGFKCWTQYWDVIELLTGRFDFKLIAFAVTVDILSNRLKQYFVAVPLLKTLIPLYINLKLMQ
jgi:hypothetical protein